MYYTFWRTDTEEIVAQGTSMECAEILGYTKYSFYDFVKRIKNGKEKKYYVYQEKEWLNKRHEYVKMYYLKKNLKGAAS